MTEPKKIPLLAVVGPTCSGKTALGVALAQAYDGEIVSADSMQVYKGLDIATAKPTLEEQGGVPHHLIGCVPLGEPFSVADYLSLARPIIAAIAARGHLPIVVGGTGLYISALLQNVQLADARENPALRACLREYAAEYGREALHKKLEALDPVAAAGIHPNNLVRIIRAIEVCTLSGKTLTQCKAESRSKPSPYQTLNIGLNYEDRSVLYDRIEKRVDDMVSRGLVEEAYDAYRTGLSPTAQNAIGYKELIPYFENTATLSSCIEQIKRETRHYAKRQLTWFHKNSSIVWIIIGEFDKKSKILEKCRNIIAKAGFL